ncbi:MAG TPA: helix-turn-helix transcriptional regulator [Clostridiales bacterium]|nr:helix-turn-helix transcriptional regulator [Clostridiales bacterium]
MKEEMVNSMYELLRDRGNDLYIQYADFDHCDVHFHQCIELALLEAGEMVITVNGKSEAFRRGQKGLAFIASYDVHHILRSDDSKIIVCIIPAFFLKGFFEAADELNYQSCFIKDQEFIDKIWLLLKELMEHKKSNLLLVKGIVYTILGHLIESKMLKTANDPAPNQLTQKVLEYLNNNFKSKITLDTLAAEFNYSKYYFSKIFNQYFACNLSTYVNMLRATYVAAQLNENSAEKNIVELAFDAGFDSMRTFYRSFYQLFKTSPKNFKKQMYCQQKAIK